MTDSFEHSQELIAFYAERYNEQLRKLKDIHALADSYYQEKIAEKAKELEQLEKQISKLRREMHEASQNERRQVAIAQKEVHEATIHMPFEEMSRELSLLREKGLDALDRRIRGKYRSVPIKSVYETPDPDLVQNLKVEFLIKGNDLSVTIIAPGLGDLARMTYPADQMDEAIQAATTVAAAELERRLRLAPALRDT